MIETGPLPKHVQKRAKKARKALLDGIEHYVPASNWQSFEGKKQAVAEFLMLAAMNYHLPNIHMIILWGGWIGKLAAGFYHNGRSASIIGQGMDTKHKKEAELIGTMHRRHYHGEGWGRLGGMLVAALFLWSVKSAVGAWRGTDNELEKPAPTPAVKTSLLLNYHGGTSRDLA